jgi:phage gp46-like protein
MTDIRLLYTNIPPSGRADFRMVGPALDTDQDLATAVTVSLFTDRLVLPSDPLPPGSDDRKGWWGDSFADKEGDLIGSKLWLLDRTKSDDKLPLRAKGYILEALQWLIEDGLAGRIDAQVEFFRGDQSKMGATVTIWRVGELKPVNLQYDWAWQQILVPQR